MNAANQAIKDINAGLSNGRPFVPAGWTPADTASAAAIDAKYQAELTKAYQTYVEAFNTENTLATEGIQSVRDIASQNASGLTSYAQSGTQNVLSQATAAANSLVSVAHDTAKASWITRIGLKARAGRVCDGERGRGSLGHVCAGGRDGLAANKIADGVNLAALAKGDAIRREAAEVASAVIANVNAQAKDMTAEAWRMPGSMAAVTGAAPSGTVAEIQAGRVEFAVHGLLTDHTNRYGLVVRQSEARLINVMQADLETDLVDSVNKFLKLSEAEQKEMLADEKSLAAFMGLVIQNKEMDLSEATQADSGSDAHRFGCVGDELVEDGAGDGRHGDRRIDDTAGNVMDQMDAVMNTAIAEIHTICSGAVAEYHDGHGQALRGQLEHPRATSRRQFHGQRSPRRRPRLMQQPRLGPRPRTSPVSHLTSKFGATS